MLKLTLLNLLFLTIVCSSNAQKAREPLFKAGIIASGTVNIFKKNTSPNLHFSAYNSGTLGGFLAWERRHVRFEFDADFGVSNFNLTYKHPTLPNVGYERNDILFNRNYQLSASGKIHLKKNRKLTLGLGFQVMRLSPIDESHYESQTVSFFDEDLGHMNNRLVLKSNVLKKKDNADFALFQQSTYHFNNYKFPFFVRLTNYLSVTNTFIKALDIIVLNDAMPQGNVERLRLGKSSFSFSLSVGMDIGHSKKFVRTQ